MIIPLVATWHPLNYVPQKPIADTLRNAADLVGLTGVPRVVSQSVRIREHLRRRR